MTASMRLVGKAVTGNLQQCYCCNSVVEHPQKALQ